MSSTQRTLALSGANFAVPIACYLMVCHAVFSIPVTGQTWPQFGGTNGNFHASWTADADSISLERIWEVEIGSGKSGIVVGEDRVFVSFRRELAGDQAAGYREGVVALERSTGRELWRHEYDCADLGDQESFSGDPRAPQATPALIGDRIVVVGFTGVMTCLSSEGGDVLWRKDLVEDFGAVPVQFGFSSSPVVHDSDVFLLTGGQRGGLCRIDPQSGETKWNIPCNEASYATPVITTLNGIEQVVFVTRNRIVGSDLSGSVLWEYTHPEPGLTNVPTPLPLQGRPDQLLVSGQGIKGSRLLQIRQQDGDWTVNELWFNNRAQFFYGNWVQVSPDIVVGCVEKFSLALSLDDGETIGRWRSFTNGNLVRGEDSLIAALDGKGQFSLGEITDSGLVERYRCSTIEGRCWTPPSIAGDHLFMRQGGRVACFDLESASGATNELEEPEYLDYR